MVNEHIVNLFFSFALQNYNIFFVLLHARIMLYSIFSKQ